MTFSPDPRTNPANKQIVDLFRKKGFEPQAYTLYSYAAVQIIKQAAEAANSLEPKKIAEIMTTAMRELRPLREQGREARRQAMEILSKPQVDRGALEALRAKQVQLADQVSRRITQSLADAAEALTPDQRAKLAERMESRRGRWHGRG